MKKVVAIFLALLMVLGALVPALAESTNPYSEEGAILEDLKVLNGSETGDLMLDKKFKRQDMVVLMSRLYGESDKAAVFKVDKMFKDVRDKFYRPYIAWSIDKKLITGMSKTEFGFGQFVTAQQYQTVLLRTLGYEKEANDWHKVPEHSTKIGIMKDLDIKPTTQIDRGVMAKMTVNALRLNINGEKQTLAGKLKLDVPSDLKVESKFTVERDVLTIRGNIKDVKDMKLVLSPVDKGIKTVEKTVEIKSNGDFEVVFDNLVSGDYNYKFVIGGKSSDSTKVTINQLPFELVDIIADNLKEIKLNFTNPVDPKSANLKSNFTTDAGEIASIRLENNGKTVVLSLDANTVMINQRSYTVNIYNIISRSGQTLKLENQKFSAFDNKQPEVVEVKALGNKRVKVTLSEPVKFPSISNFKVDEKRFTGRITNKDNIVTLIYPSYQNIEDGNHVLNISGLEDYAGYRGLTVDKNFKVEKDTKSPVVVNSTASLEEVELEFDKEIDETTVNRSDFYWMSGGSKRHPDTIEVSDKKINMVFSGNNILPSHETTLFMNNVKDYFGNSLNSSSLKIKAEVDTTNPTVLSAEVSADGKSISVVYSKNVSASNKNDYKVVDKNKKIVSILNVEGSGRNFKINLSKVLPEGTNTLNIEGVKDTTALKNQLIPFRKDFNMGDIEIPSLSNYSGKDKDIILMFNKDMDLQTVTNPNNYLIEIGGRMRYLPNNVNFEIIGDNRTVKIVLPRYIDGVDVKVGENLKKMQLIGLKGSNGILMPPTLVDFKEGKEAKASMKSATLKTYNTVEASFDQPILNANKDDFYISGETIKEVQALGNNIVRLVLDRDENNTGIEGQLELKSSNRLSTALNTGANGSKIFIGDEVAPKIKPSNNLGRSAGTIYLDFTEKLDSSLASVYSRDLEVEKVGSGKVNFSTSVNGSEMRIYVQGEKPSDEYIVRLVSRPSLISDKAGNVIEPDGRDYMAR